MQPSGAEFLDLPFSLWEYANEQLKLKNSRIHKLLNGNHFVAALLRGRLVEERTLTAGERSFVELEVQKGIWSPDFLDVRSVGELATKLRGWYTHAYASVPDKL